MAASLIYIPPTGNERFPIEAWDETKDRYCSATPTCVFPNGRRSYGRWLVMGKAWCYDHARRIRLAQYGAMGERI